MTDRETETEGPPLSKWRRLKESLLGRKPTAPAEELKPINQPDAAPIPEPPADPPAATPFSSLSPDSPAPMEKGNRDKKGRSERRQMAKVVAARLTPSEYAAIAEKAARAGLSLSAFARACLLGNPGLRAKRAPPIHGDLLAQAITALNRVGNNVNQIAHNLNAGGHPDSKQIAEAKAELSACIKAFLKALGKRP